MNEPTGLTHVEAQAGVVRGLVAGLDPDAVPLPQVPHMWSAFGTIARLAGAAQLLLARRVDESPVWKDQGCRTSAEYLARVSGGSVRGAQDVLRASKKLDRVPVVEQALRRGELSVVQAEMITDAAAENPTKQQQLVDAAGRLSLVQLGEECGRVKAAADPDPEKTYQRIRANRRLRQRSDGEGAWCLHGRGTPDDGALFRYVLEPLIDEMFDDARREGRHEHRDAYAYDALLELCRRYLDAEDEHDAEDEGDDDPDDDPDQADDPDDDSGEPDDPGEEDDPDDPGQADDEQTEHPTETGRNKDPQATTSHQDRPADPADTGDRGLDGRPGASSDGGTAATGERGRGGRPGASGDGSDDATGERGRGGRPGASGDGSDDATGERGRGGRPGVSGDGGDDATGERGLGGRPGASGDGSDERGLGGRLGVPGQGGSGAGAGGGQDDTDRSRVSGSRPVAGGGPARSSGRPDVDERSSRPGPDGRASQPQSLSDNGRDAASTHNGDRRDRPQRPAATALRDQAAAVGSVGERATATARTERRRGRKRRKRSRSNPRYLALLRVDVTALQRGHVEDGEIVEIAGIGPIPVNRARELLGDSIVKLVITKGVPVRSVTHLGRKATAAQRVALLWQTPSCSNQACPHSYVQIDHRIDWAKTHHTRLDELDPLCPHCHRLKTHHDWALINGTGKRPFVPPTDPRHPNHTQPTNTPNPPTPTTNHTPPTDPAPPAAPAGLAGQRAALPAAPAAPTAGPAASAASAALAGQRIAGPAAPAAPADPGACAAPGAPAVPGAPAAPTGRRVAA